MDFISDYDAIRLAGKLQWRAEGFGSGCGSRASVADREAPSNMRPLLEFIDEGDRIVLEGNSAATLVAEQLILA
jgi:hypothetical protein